MRRAAPFGVVLLLAGCSHELSTISEASYRHAVTVGGTRLLTERGYPLDGRLRCQASSPDGWHTVTVSCTGRTTANAVVELTGQVTNADTRHPLEQYLIRIADRPVISATNLIS